MVAKQSHLEELDSWLPSFTYLSDLLHCYNKLQIEYKCLWTYVVSMSGDPDTEHDWETFLKYWLSLNILFQARMQVDSIAKVNFDLVYLPNSTSHPSLA